MGLVTQDTPPADKALDVVYYCTKLGARSFIHSKVKRGPRY